MVYVPLVCFINGVKEHFLVLPPNSKEWEYFYGVLFASLRDENLSKFGLSFNLLYTGGLFHYYMLDQSICHFRGVRPIYNINSNTVMSSNFLNTLYTLLLLSVL